MTRFCTTCRSDVQDVGGYCLEGHELEIRSLAETLAELRAEVSKTYEETREELRVRLDPLILIRDEAVADLGAPPPPPPPPFQPRPPALAARMTPPPAPPPARRVDDAPSIQALEELWLENEGELSDEQVSERVESQHQELWATLGEDIAAAPEVADDDPIMAFAPEDSLDWGPKRPTWF